MREVKEIARKGIRKHLEDINSIVECADYIYHDENGTYMKKRLLTTVEEEISKQVNDIKSVTVKPKYDIRNIKGEVHRYGSSIRLMPGNYQILRRSGDGRWVCDPDRALPHKVAKASFLALWNCGTSFIDAATFIKSIQKEISKSL